MLPLVAVDEVRGLLAEGRSQRATARATGVSRGTVAAIAHDRWAPLRGERRRRAAAGPIVPPSSAELISAARRAAANRGPEPLRELFASSTPTLELRPNERHEYLEVRKRLRAQGELPPEEEIAEPDPRAA